MFWVISVYFNLRNTLPKFGTFLLGHPVYIYIYIYIYIHTYTRTHVHKMYLYIHTYTRTHVHKMYQPCVSFTATRYVKVQCQQPNTTDVSIRPARRCLSRPRHNRIGYLYHCYMFDQAWSLPQGSFNFI